MSNLVSEVNHSLKPVGYNSNYHMRELSSQLEQEHSLNNTYTPINGNVGIPFQSTEVIPKLISQEPTFFNEVFVTRYKKLKKKAKKSKQRLNRDENNEHPSKRVIVTNQMRPNPDFFVPPHPVIAILIPYGLLLTFSSALIPENIPSYLPLGELAKYLGNEYPTLMQFLALFAASIHVAYPFYILKLAVQYELMLKQTLLWSLNGLLFGIFAIWPLLFYDFYLENRTEYCNIPLTIC